MSNRGGWVGFDLDETTALYTEWTGASSIGEPIPPMVKRIKDYLAAGVEVRIFTARASTVNSMERDSVLRDESIAAVQKWCLEHVGQVLPVTCEKDYRMIRLYDDRAVQVVPNTGLTLRGVLQDLVRSIHGDGPVGYYDAVIAAVAALEATK